MEHNLLPSDKEIREMFLCEIEAHSKNLKNWALYTYEEALKYGYPYIRESKPITNDGETMFKHKDTHVYFIAINTKRNKVKLVTEDKIGFIDPSEFDILVRSQSSTIYA